MKKCRVLALLMILTVVGSFRAYQVLNPHLELSNREAVVTLVLYSDLPESQALSRQLERFRCDGVACVQTALSEVIENEFKRHTSGDTSLKVNVVEPKDNRLFRVDHSGTGWRRFRFAYKLYSEFSSRGASFFGSDVRIFVNISNYDPQSYVERSLGSANLRVGMVQWDVGDFQNIYMWNITKLVHEIGHTLGASDKYTSAAKSIFPGGYVEPELGEGSNQQFVEIMSGTRPSGGQEELEPKHYSELRFSRVSASEMGWVTQN